MANLYLVAELPSAAATLTGDVAHHLARVLRCRPGDTIQLGDGRGTTATATVTSVRRDEVDVTLAAHRRHEPLRPALTLAFPCPKGARADWLFEHATEVGVAVLQPLSTQRSRPQGPRLDRWRKLVRAAAGQCARPFLPHVAEPVELAAFVARAPGPLRVLADAAGPPLRPAAAEVRQATLLVGPEGGFTADERSSAIAAGFRPARLAGHILRTETAALVGAGLLLSSARQVSCRR